MLVIGVEYTAMVHQECTQKKMMADGSAETLLEKR